jgi:hypothetical protein
MRIGRATSAFLLLFGIWTWILWPNFLRKQHLGGCTTRGAEA